MENGLRKELKLSGMIAMAAGGMIAAWMVEIRYWFELSGVGSVVSLVTCAVLVLPLCFIYAEMTSMMPYAGGQNIWVTNALGWNVGFGACWLVMLLYVMAMPTVAYGIASMVGYLVPIDALQTKIMAAVILVVWFFLSNKEMKLLARLQNILFWSTLAVSLAASLIFVFSGHWSFQTMEPIFPNGFSGYTAAVALLIMKFVGFDLIPSCLRRPSSPRKTCGRPLWGPWAAPCSSTAWPWWAWAASSPRTGSSTLTSWTPGWPT